VLQPFESGTELALGAFVDPVFGPSVMVALGGIFLEVLRDTVFAPAPVTNAEARDMVLRLKAAAVLRGARGRPPADIDAVAQALAALSRFIADNAERYAEIDINPLIVRPEGQGAVAVDALLVVRG
jgi:acyl-CoA synthetase (NDP forming)